MIESRIKGNNNQHNWITIEKFMHQTSNKGQCCQQPNYKDLAIKTTLTKELWFKIRLVKVKNYLLRISS